MGGTPLTLVHLSDPHLPTTGGLSLRHLTLKRTLGYLNWQYRRKGVFSGALVDRLIADIKEHAADHIAVTGDLVNLGLPSELEAAAGWLRALGSRSDVSVVPGNHDTYVRLHRDPGVARWREYMLSDAFGDQILGETGGREDGFPFVRKLDQVALIGLNSAVPTPPFVAAGALGEAQLARLPGILQKLEKLGLVRVVLIHHPPLARQTSRLRGLRDADALEGVLSQFGAELVLHGHNHTNSLTWLEGRGGRIPILGIASAGMATAAEGAGALARYNLIRFLGAGADRRIEVIGRGLAVPRGPIVDLDRRDLSLKGELTGAVALE
jgi:3',5'-cyclic AMP phosphodiesterase CpdA